MRRLLPAFLVSVCVISLTALGLLACASGTAPSGDEPASAQAAQGMAPPAGSKLAKVQMGMNEGEVRKIMGDPDSSPTYTTGKAWIPFYYGSDATRTDWKYKGVGRVVFGHNRWSGAQRVIRVDYDPQEDGY
jgi:outer membrane protein assembly factor BamE (lipoprotein component of BamABCDE complex)